MNTPTMYLRGDSIADERGHHQIKYNDKNEVIEYLLNGVVQPNKPYQFAERHKEPIGAK